MGWALILISTIGWHSDVMVKKVAAYPTKFECEQVEAQLIHSGMGRFICGEDK
jgi:hypothetical protein